MLFEKVKQMAEVTANTAAKVVKDAGENAKSYSQIYTEEQKIRDAYLEIGKLYFALNEEQPDPAFADLFSQIHASMNKIEECNNYVERIGVKRPDFFSGKKYTNPFSKKAPAEEPDSQSGEGYEKES